MLEHVETPYYLIEEDLLRRNLGLISDIAERAGVEFILAFKAYALWRTFPIFREYIHATTASSPYEARLAREEFGGPCHTYSPAYEQATFGEVLRCSSHVTFNSLTQVARFLPQVAAWNASHAEPILCGLRINPELSQVSTALYDPCAPGSRLGVTAAQLPPRLPEGISGLHVHCLCESSAGDLERLLRRLEERFAPWLEQISWLNLGGGHLVTHRDYDVEHLVSLLTAFKARHPGLKLVLEPGSAFAWQTGPLVAGVVDVVANSGIKTAILNVSFTCHMPDCLEMPYLPAVRGAETLPPESARGHETEPTVYRLGGNSCLSGDFMGYWRFPRPLKCGDEILFEDMNHYTTVKTNMFNGIAHPAICLRRHDGTLQVLRTYSYEDYRSRMD